MSEGPAEPYLPLAGYDNIHDYCAVESRRPTEAHLRVNVRVTDAYVEVAVHELSGQDEVCGRFVWAKLYLRPPGKTRSECVAAGLRAVLLRQEAGSLLR